MPLGAAEEIVDQRHRLGKRDRRELDAIDHVADRIDARHVGAGVVVDENRAVGVELDADRLEAESAGVRARPVARSTASATSRAAVAESDPRRAVGVGLERATLAPTRRSTPFLIISAATWSRTSRSKPRRNCSPR